LFIATLSLTSIVAETPTEDLLRQGLFEEEANRDFDKAAERYHAVVAAHDRQRSLAATATFRLGEIARKKNDKEAAAAAFRTVIARFPEQEDLARLSRENLAALGMAPVAAHKTEKPAAPTVTDSEDAEIARLKEIARNSPDLLDGPDGIGWRPIHHAAKNGWTKVISYLLENKSDPNGRTSKDKLTPLLLATIHGHLGTVTALLAAKADISATFGIYYCSKEFLPPTDRKVENAAGGWTALDVAVLYDRREIARTLIKSGADIKRTGLDFKWKADDRLYQTFTTLLAAIYLQRNDLAMLLVEAGSPLTVVSSKDALTPLDMAVRYNPGLVAPLLKAGADPNYLAGTEGEKPLHSAVKSQRVDIAKLLIEAGADPKVADSEGFTALHLATSPEMVDLLVSKGADPNSKADDGTTPLDLTVGNDLKSSPATFEALLKHGATTANAKALLNRTSSTMLPIVREQVVYPKEHRPDAILLSLDGDSRINPSSLQGGPSLMTLEVRPSAESPPPTLAEALCEVFGRGSYPQSIRILRRRADGGFEAILEWAPAKGGGMPEKWPALQWGDIVELRVTTSQIAGKSLPGIDDLKGQIADRTITVRLGESSFLQKISGKGRYWTNGYQNDEKMFEGLEALLDFSRFTVVRKGGQQPIKVDFTQPGAASRFRFVDGDTVEMAFNTKALDRQFGIGNTSHLRWAGGDNDLMNANGNLSWGLIATQNCLPGNTDLSRIVVLRKAENWKLERLDMTVWLDSLPTQEKWSRDAISASVPEIKAGEVVLLFPVADEKAAAKSEKALNKLKDVGALIWHNEHRARVVPPPNPQQ
jgi:ankyrin repeat protein